MKKSFLIMAVLAALCSGVWAGSFDDFVPEVFGIGGAASFETQHYGGESYSGGGYALNLQGRTNKSGKTSLMFSVDLGIFLTDKNLDEDNVYEDPFMSVCVLFGYGWNVVNTPSSALTISGVAGVDGKIFEETWSHKNYDIVCSENFISLVGGVNLHYRKFFSEKVGMYFEVNALAGAGFETVKAEKEYNNGDVVTLSEKDGFEFSTYVTPKIGMIVYW